MKIALFYASWEKFGEPWSTPLGVKWELEAQGHEIVHYNLYHADGQFLPKRQARTYSADCWNRFNFDYKHGYVPDVALVMDYGPFDCLPMDKKYFPDVVFALEAGDTPQSFRLHAQKAHKFHVVMTPDKESARLFNTIPGVTAAWITHHADHRIFYPRENINPVFDCVTTCGGRRVTAEIQAALGDSFNNDRYFFGNDHAERLCMGKMVFQCSQYGEITRRVFEGMACGRMVITDRLPEATGMSEIFIDGEDIIYYDNAQDAIDKIKYYASHDNERETIAANGYKKVMQHHTVANRINDFVSLVQSAKSVLI